MITGMGLLQALVAALGCYLVFNLIYYGTCSIRATFNKSKSKKSIDYAKTVRLFKYFLKSYAIFFLVVSVLVGIFELPI